LGIFLHYWLNRRDVKEFFQVSASRSVA
jgi:hypothetical protein